MFRRYQHKGLTLRTKSGRWNLEVSLYVTVLLMLCFATWQLRLHTEHVKHEIVERTNKLENVVTKTDKQTPTTTQKEKKSSFEKTEFYARVKKTVLGDPNKTCADVFRQGAEEEAPGALFTPKWDKQQQQNEKYFEKAFKAEMYSKRMDRWSGSDYVDLYPDLRKIYSELARMDFVKTICETGFLAGHSAFVWLNSNLDVKLYSFEISARQHVSKAAQLLNSIFGDRLHMEYGDSKRSLGQFHKDHPEVSCDLIVVDGGQARNDLGLFRPMASKHHLVLLYDAYALQTEVFKEFFSCKNDKTIAKKLQQKKLFVGHYL